MIGHRLFRLSLADHSSNTAAYFSENSVASSIRVFWCLGSEEVYFLSESLEHYCGIITRGVSGACLTFLRQLD